MTAIEIENLSKQYALGKIGSGTLTRDLNVLWARMRGKPNPYLKIGQTNDRSQKADGDFVWALKDINFKVEEGDVVGIIGKNGAGKSTLLKILSRITTPTTGRITTYGRVASLLEVGTGFHGEMTGRENIYMNGSIMGMTRAEITRKLDEIVDFAGVEKYIDTPVKRYSSGMTVRLGFAVAAFLEPEILIVDEVLAVGDAEFQKKAIGKMQDVSSNGGRTVLFVSHNMQAVKMLCKSGIVLNNGMIEKVDKAEDCVNYYIDNMHNRDIVSKVVDVSPYREHYGMLIHGIDFISVEMLNNHPDAVATDEPLLFRTTMRANHTYLDFQLCIFFINTSDVRVQFCMTETLRVPSDRDIFDIEVMIPNHFLPRGHYFVRFETNNQDFTKGSVHYDFLHNVLSFEVKYIHKKNKDEYLFWQPRFGETLLLGKDNVVTRIL